MYFDPIFKARFYEKMFGVKKKFAYDYGYRIKVYDMMASLETSSRSLMRLNFFDVAFINGHIKSIL